MKTVTLNNQIFQLSRERSKRLATQQTRVRSNQTVIATAIARADNVACVSDSQLPAMKHAGLIFDPAGTYGSVLAQLLGAPNDGLPVTGADLADAIRLTALKIKSGDVSFLRETLLGQAAVIEALMMEAARDYHEAETNRNWRWGRVRLREFLALQKALLRAVEAVARLPISAAT